MDRELISTSKFLSPVLRHRPEKSGLRLDGEGWVEIDGLLYQGRALKQIDANPATDIRRNEKITVPGSGWLAERCLGRGDNPNLSPAFDFAHTSPFYVLVDGRSGRRRMPAISTITSRRS